MNHVAESTNQKTKTANSSVIYLPGLNGLRAIAALAVVISHTTLALGTFGLNNKIVGTDIYGNARGMDLAGSGVTIFFTLSGFLISYLLLKEKETGPLNVKNFYIRRLLRIWPLYYLYFAVSMIVAICFGIVFQSSLIPFYIFLAANVPFILGKSLPFLVHYWSLGVEEQFYLFFPHLAKQSNKKLLKTSLLLIFFFFFLRCIFWGISKFYRIELPLLAVTVSRFHIMLIGVTAAILYYKKDKRFMFITTHKITQVVSWVCLFVVAINKFHIWSLIDAELVSLLTVFLIMGQITRKNYTINLENRYCDFVGKISYGIYVIHPLLIFIYSKLLTRFTSGSFLNYVIVYCVVISSTIIIAWASYDFFEKRFLKLKAKYTTIKSSGTKTALPDVADKANLTTQ